ncbi:MAG: hypothetical protein WC728_01500 [Elusimicrobiota bacterium]
MDAGRRLALLFCLAAFAAGTLVLSIALCMAPALPPRWVLFSAAAACYLAGFAPMLRDRLDPLYSILILTGLAVPFNWAAFQAGEELVRELLAWDRMSGFGLVLLAVQGVVVAFTAVITVPLDVFLFRALKRAVRPSPAPPRTP